MSGHPTVGVDNNFASGKASIAHRTPDNESAGGIDDEPGVRIDPLRWNGLPDYKLCKVLFNDVVADVRVMLSGNNDGVHPGWLAISVLDRNLGFPVRS